MKFKIETITPEMAAKMLERNPRNRHIRKSVVERYASDMTAGRWLLTGEPVIFDGSDNLIDGQHRLAAIVLADKKVDLAVVRGTSPNSFNVIDSGVSRSPADALGVSGYDNSQQLSIIGRRLLLAEVTGTPAAAFAPGGRGNTVSHIGVVDFCRKHDKRIIGAINAIKEIGDGHISPVRTTLLMTLYALLKRPYQEQFLKFCRQVISGTDVAPGSPAYILRRALIVNGSRMRNALRHSGAITIKAWNAFAEERPLAFVRFSEIEAFPDIVGCVFE